MNIKCREPGFVRKVILFEPEKTNIGFKAGVLHYGKGHSNDRKAENDIDEYVLNNTW